MKDNNKYTVCVRCGKPRILLSTVEETVGTSNIVTTEVVCPDPECQAKVAAMLDAERDRRINSANARVQNMSKVRRDLKLNK